MLGGKGVLFPLLAALCWAAFFYKLHDLRAKQREPALIALLVAFGVKGFAFLLATPGIAAGVDRRVGIPDLSALGIHLLGGVAFAAAVLVVLVYWAEPPEQAWRTAQWRLAVAALVMMVMFVLWVAVGIGAGERSTSYLVQNAHRPLAAIYLCLYVAALLISLGEIARLCLKYAGSAGRSWLRRGLRTTAAGALIYSVNFWTRASAIVAVQFGLDPLEWEVVILLGAGIGMPLMIAGLTMPGWGPHLSGLRRWWDTYSTYRRLRPLWRDLHDLAPGIALHARTRSIADANYRLYRRVIEIRDGLLALRAYRDPEVGRRAMQGGEAAGLTGEDLRAAVVAAQVRAALDARATGRDPVSCPGVDYDEVLENGVGKDLGSEAAWLAQVALIYTRGCR